MNFGFLTEDFRIPAGRLVALIIMFASIFACFILFYLYVLHEKFLTLGVVSSWYYVEIGVFHAAIAFSAILGSLISEKVDRRKYLWFGLTFGTLFTASFALVQGLVLVLLNSALLGISFGLIFPTCYALLVDYTTSENRARVFGIVFLASFVVIMIAYTAFSALSIGLVHAIAVCILLRMSGFATLFLDPCKRESGKSESWLSILNRRDFVLYLFPWLMFNISDGLTHFVDVGKFVPADIGIGTMAIVLQYGASIIFFIIAGVMADWFGRKWPIYFGLVALGITYGFLGVYGSVATWLLVMLTDGIAWGMIVVSYSAVLGDLATSGSRERYFALGGIMNSFILQAIFLALAQSLNIFIPASIISPVLSIMLFISVIPVLRARETLPDSRMRAKRMEQHIKKVAKLVQESKEPR